MASFVSSTASSDLKSPVANRAASDYVLGCLKAHDEAQSDAARGAVVTLLGEQAQSQAAGSGDAQVSSYRPILAELVACMAPPHSSAQQAAARDMYPAVAEEASPSAFRVALEQAPFFAPDAPWEMLGASCVSRLGAEQAGTMFAHAVWAWCAANDAAEPCSDITMNKLWAAATEAGMRLHQVDLPSTEPTPAHGAEVIPATAKRSATADGARSRAERLVARITAALKESEGS